RITVMDSSRPSMFSWQTTDEFSSCPAGRCLGGGWIQMVSTRRRKSARRERASCSIRDRQSPTSALPVLLFPRIALARRAAEPEVLAVGAPRLGREARGACNRHHVAVCAALRPLVGRAPPAARPELHDGCRRLRGVDRAVGVGGAVGLARRLLRGWRPERL